MAIDADTLARLNAGEGTPVTTVTDPELLKRLNTPKEEKESDPWYEDLAEGVAVSGMGTYYGIKDLLVGMDEEDKATLKDWQDDASESGWGTAGKVAGEIAQIALPAGGALKGLKLLSKAGKVGRTAPAIADIAATAGFEYLQAPTGDKSRLENALEGAKDAATGAMLTRALSKITRGVDITPEAKTILDKGGYLTAGKAAESKGVQMLEDVAEVTPFLAKSIKKAQEKARASWDDIVTKDAAPEGYKILGKGQEAVKQLRNAYDDAYEKAWAGASNISNSGRVGFINAANNAAKYLPKNDVRRISDMVAEFGETIKAPSARKIKSFDNALRKQIQKAPYDNKELIDGLNNMREAFRTGLPKETLEKLAKVDAQYPKYLAIKKATAKAADTKGEFTPKQLLAAVKQVGGETRTAMGDAPLQDLASAGVQTIDRKVGGQPLEWFRRVAGGVPSPVPTQTISNMVIGQNPLQKGARTLVNSDYINALRNYMPRGGQVGGAYLDEGEE